ncbi:phage antirepressor KilAC domain-containing protein [Phocaeicola vulgatus]|jgi:phage antirepressor YoqD-like protein|uniref:phage antirepressor KilAC domain-containing protein n=1 Tax=Phocaeicola vulgatus TaxID=821 RepID=UPI00189FC812|nr:phage antirepressor KilAC domain-containing protein [Phocaeicola vulgatus]UVM89794.1 MAG: antirepressor protein KilAC domain protein [Bacteriophage sp.]MBU8982645.1 phage antirepressor KilAC domain-containing protein [Phocaeicola vulgatus]MBU9016050.1 phage antirepressor KilAC domain-containing protein [Phocaeicola vulgatus]MBU9033920.1 phage antirepressor KilAC domain-containing protein [Phocaeicola vulgatus]MBU9046808.1 phage antirepressor KilAC domain-containing protein [Phocaeicola vulg
MAKEIIKFDYNGNQIPFENGSNVMVNLTAMAKAYPDKNLTQIVNSQEIKEYCASLSKLQNYSLADLLQVRRGGDNPGTWAHRLVAIRVAQKLNSDLAVWVDMRIEELLTTGNTSLQPQLPNFNNPAEAARAWADQYEKNQTLALEVQQQQETIELQQQELTQSAPKVTYYDNHLQSVNTQTSTQAAKQIGMDAEKLHKKLKEIGIIYRQSGQWILHAPYSTWGMHSTRTQTYTRSDGSIGTSVYTVWTQRGVRFIIALYENGWNVKKAIKQIKGELNPAA